MGPLGRNLAWTVGGHVGGHVPADRGSDHMPGGARGEVGAQLQQTPRMLG